MEDIYIVAGLRTPFGSFGGGLASVTATDLTVHAAKATLAKSGIKTDDVDHVIIGNVVQSSSDAAYLARHVGLKVGIPVDRPAYIVNRLCGSGFQAWINASQLIQTGGAKVVLAGGTENMSQIPYVLRKARFEGYRMGPGELEDYMTASLTDQYTNTPMAMTAENLGEQYGITRAACDEYSYESQKRCKLAVEKKIFAEEISPVTIEGKKGAVQITNDEHPKPDITLEKIKNLKPLFKKDGLVTAATSSGIVDGAATTVLVSASFAKEKGLKPLARIVSYSTVGCDPKIMGIGPVEAIRKALAKAGLKQDQMDLFEVNEAFAAQYLSVEKELGLPRERTNVNGGAIAIGHPLAASGTRIMNHLVLELARRNARYAVGSACIGGGQGTAIVIERI